VTLRSKATARRALKNAVVVPAVDLPAPDGTVVFDANPALSAARDKAFSALTQVGALVAPAADKALGQVAVTLTPDRAAGNGVNVDVRHTAQGGAYGVVTGMANRLLGLVGGRLPTVTVHADATALYE
jgi:hypothetical protein